MLRRLIWSVRPPVGLGVGQTQGGAVRTAAYFCFNESVPVIPPCYWTQLANGVRIITEQTCSPLACVALYAEAGPRYETPCNNGACHFFEHMALKGFRDLKRAAFEQAIRALGAHFTIHTDREYQAFIATCPPEGVDSMIKHLGNMFTDLDCDELDIVDAKSTIFKEMTQVEDDPKQLTMDYLHQIAFQGTNMQLAVIGPWRNYDSFNASFLKEFVAQHYQPFRLILSVSSIFSHDDIVSIAQRAFGNMKKSTNELVFWPTRYTGSILRFRNDSMPYLHLAIAVEVGGYTSPDYIHLQLMRHILGTSWDASQHSGYSTWPFLAHASAVSKLCSHYETFYFPYRDVGLFGVYAVIDKNDDSEDILYQIQSQMKHLCVTTQYTDLQRAAASFKLELAREVLGCKNTCHNMAMHVLYFGLRKNLLEMYDSVDLITYMDIREVADRVIYDRCPVVVGVGPTESVIDYQRIRTNMYWLRL